MNDIVPITLDRFNETNFSLPLAFKVSASRVVEDTSSYNVCVRKLEVPVNSKAMPINPTTESFDLAIFNEYKPTDKVIPGLEYGLNLFSIPGPVYTVKAFIESLNHYIFKLTGGILGYFELDDDNDIFYQYNQQHADEHDMFKIYFSPKIRRLFAFDYDSSDVIGEMHRLHIVKDFSPTTGVSVVKVESQEFTFPLFYTLKGVRIRTSLPITPHMLQNRDNGLVENSNVLANITYNSAVMFNNRNILYEPPTFVYCSMSDVGSLRSFDLSFSLFYADGTELPLVLEPLDYASVTVSFEKKGIF